MPSDKFDLVVNKANRLIVDGSLLINGIIISAESIATPEISLVGLGLGASLLAFRQKITDMLTGLANDPPDQWRLAGAAAVMLMLTTIQLGEFSEKQEGINAESGEKMAVCGMLDDAQARLRRLEVAVEYKEDDLCTPSPRHVALHSIR